VLGRTLPPRSLLTPSAGRKGVPRNRDALFLSERLAGRRTSGYDFRLFVSATSQPTLCDGCGLPASPEHIRQRLARLEAATRFRPIHIGVLFLIPSPPEGPDFYDPSPRPLGARELLLDALGIAAPSEAPGGDGAAAIESRLSDFQRRGFYFASLSECPLPESAASQALSRLGPTLLKRIQFSYKPKSVVLLSGALAPLLPMLAAAGQGIRVLPQGTPLAWPRRGDLSGEAAFRAGCACIATAAPRT
jgi:hypothetical protein